MTLQSTALFIHRHYKLVLTSIGAALIIFLFIFGVSSNLRNVNASTHNEKYFKCIGIEADDTLWSIAEEYMTEEYSSTEEYIDEVKSINNLMSDKIYSGATLVIPYYASPK